MSLDQHINNYFQPVADAIASVVFSSVSVFGADLKIIVLWTVSAALFFTLYFGFMNIRYFKHAIDVVTGKFDKKSDEGHISSWQALMTSMSGTVGLGNIAGVAVAISIGGPGAVFWMIVFALLSMSLKFIEVYLGVKFRQSYDIGDGKYHVSGGPMYYIKAAFDHVKLPQIGTVVAMMFATFCVIGSIGGGMIFQANQSYQQIFHVTGGDSGFFADKGWLFGAILSLLVGVVVVGGIESIAKVSSRLVPAMAALYIAAALFVVFTNYEKILPALSLIVTSAFDFKAGISGFLTVMFVGAQRAVFSNESGLGTAAIVYASAKGKVPMRQGIASILGPVIDTVLVCSITALMILISGVYDPSSSIQGVELTSKAMAEGASWLPIVLSVVIVLFAYSTMITYAYISSKAFSFMFGKNPVLNKGYNVFYCLCAILGAVSPLSAVIDFTDAAFLSMAFPNIIGLFLLAALVRKDLSEYKRS